MKRSIDDLKEMAAIKNGFCLSNTYIKMNYKYKWQCAEGHIWEAFANNIYKGSWCLKCSIKNQYKYNIDYLKEFAIKNGGECLSKKYISYKDKLQFKCKYDHIFLSSPNTVLSQKSWCPDCGGTKLLTIEHFKKIAKLRGGECLSNEYIGSKVKLSFKCNKGHIWLGTPETINRNIWCPICKSSSGERLIAELLTNNEIKFHQQKTFPNCVFKKHLRFDFYLPNFNTCIEFDGQQHFINVDIKGWIKSSHILNKKRDEFKNRYCKTNNIKLIRIPYWKKDKIKSILIKNGIISK